MVSALPLAPVRTLGQQQGRLSLNDDCNIITIMLYVNHNFFRRASRSSSFGSIRAFRASAGKKSLKSDRATESALRAFQATND
jgi:hypothetical protein